jgi:hypothetical protein
MGRREEDSMSPVEIIFSNFKTLKRVFSERFLQLWDGTWMNPCFKFL